MEMKEPIIEYNQLYEVILFNNESVDDGYAQIHLEKFLGYTPALSEKICKEVIKFGKTLCFVGTQNECQKVIKSLEKDKIYAELNRVF
jgi:ATP-dependent Clp protease adapter protein ClpS